MNLKELDDILRTQLAIADYDDISLNGVQVACSPDRQIARVAVAVDACQATIDAAIQEKADMLFVHHGLFWGRPIAVDGIHYNRVKALLDADVALYACHLPLDAHPVLGNNAQMAMCLGMKEFDPFGMYHGQSIGYKGRLPFPMTCQEIAKLLGFSELYGMNILPFGSGMDMVCGGHYQSEVFGVKAVARYLEKEHGIQTVFIDRKTGL